jgi:hypothetical protein
LRVERGGDPRTNGRFAVIVNVAEQNLARFDQVSRQGFIRPRAALDHRLPHAIGEAEMLVVIRLAPGSERTEFGEPAPRELALVFPEKTVKPPLVFAEE